MTERPILFSGPMVRAILAGNKTQTRRVVKPQPEMVTDDGVVPWDGPAQGLLQQLALNGRKCPYGHPGDRLWVRETWADDSIPGRPPVYIYKADYDPALGRWRPSIHMPRAASRLLLEVLSVRVERVQDISEGDAFAEGLDRLDRGIDGKPQGPWACNEGWGSNDKNSFSQHGWDHPKMVFADLWDSINAKRGFGWDANPWVWVVEFKRVQP